MRIGMRTWRRRAVLVVALAATLTTSVCPVAASAEPVAPTVSAAVAAHAAVLRAAGMAPEPAPTPSATVDADGAELFEPLGGRTIGIGDAHTCVATLFEVVWCWGANGSGQLGDGSTDDSAVPVQAGPDSALKDKYPLAVAAGRAHTCVLALSEYLETALYCWGDNGQGQLGDSSLTSRTSPVQVAAQAYQVAVGRDHTCIVTEERTVSCWGRNDAGQLGIGTLSAAESTPQEVPGLTDIIEISAGADNTCAVDGDGKAWCWGSDGHGQLGDGGGPGTPQTSPVPVTMTEVDDGFLRIDVGARHVCAVANGGGESSPGLYCWGDDSAGQLGNGGSAADASEPSAVSTVGPQFVTVAAGDDASCATTVTGAAYCWGDNGDGRLGVGDTTDRNTPTLLDTSAIPSSPITEFFLGSAEVMLVDVNVGAGHGCAVTVQESVYCWGSNTTGQLGDGSTDDADAPIATALMPGPATQVRAAAGDESLPVTWVAPADTGVAPVREYAAIALDSTDPDAGSADCQTDGTPACTVTDLVNGRPYDVVVATATLGGVSFSDFVQGTPRGARAGGGGGGGLPITGRDVALPLAAGGLLLGTGLLLLSISRSRLRRNP